MSWPQLIPWVSPHPLISQPQAASFRPLPFNGSFHCSVVHRLTPMDQTRDVHTDCAHALLSMVYSVCIFYSIMYFLQCLHQAVSTLARCGTTPCPSFCPHSTGLQQSDPINWTLKCPWTPPQTFLHPESLSGKFCFHTDLAVGESFVVTPLFQVKLPFFR